MNSPWSIRLYRNGDENGIFELWKTIHKESIDYDEWMIWWKWKFMENPAGSSRIFLADYKGKIVGLYPLISTKMKIKKDIVLGSQAVNLMVHPDYRRQGLFIKLANRVFEESGIDDMFFSIGFPNLIAYGGHIKTGWSDISQIQTIVKPIRIKNILKKKIHNVYLLNILYFFTSLFLNLFYRSQKIPNAEGIEIKQVASFNDNINKFWENISCEYDLATIRDMEYLNWRYVKIPKSNYTIYVAKDKDEICGYIVLSIGEEHNLKIGYIVDLVFPKEKSRIGHLLISKSIEKFYNENIDLIFYQMIGNNIYHKLFRKNGFIFSRFFSKRFRFIVRVNSNNIPKKLIFNPSYWFIQQGDSDNI